MRPSGLKQGPAGYHATNAFRGLSGKETTAGAMKPITRTPPRSGTVLRRVHVVALVTMTAGLGCATKGDVRDLRGELDVLANRQNRALLQLEFLTEANRDSLASQSDALFQLRGDVLQELLAIQTQLVTLQELTGQSQRALTELRDRIETQRTMLQTPVTSADSSTTDRDDRDTDGPENVFDATVRLFNRGSNNTARRGFEQFLQAYPNHELAGDANYYLSDILVQEERLEEAISGFMRIPELYPASPRVPDALYRAGILHVELDDVDEGRTLLQRVVNSYPDSNAASLAEERIRDLP